MEIISLESGRSTWLFPVEEFLPLGGTDSVGIIEKVAQRYDFKNFPKNPTREDVDKNGLKFTTGTFEFEGKRAGLGEFALYNDGLVAISNVTERSTAFLEDVMRFVIEEFQFRTPISLIKKINVSILTVEFDRSVAAMFANHEALMSLVGGYLNAPLHTSHPTEVSRLDISLDDSNAAPNARPKLILESRSTVPLARRRYYSNAALHTKDHLELLAKIEEIFIRGSAPTPHPPATGKPKRKAR